MEPDLPRIASRGNAQFKALRALAGSATQRRRERRTLIDGAHLVARYLGQATPLLIAVSEAALPNAEVQALLERGRAAPTVILSAQLFAQIAPVQTPTGILALIEIPAQPGTAAAGDFIVLLDAVQDPGNVGTIIRTAAGAGADAVLLSEQCADAWSPRTLRAAMGAHFDLAIHDHCDLQAALRTFDGRVVATAGRGGMAPQAVSLTGKVAVAFGSEGAGLSPALRAAASAHISIPLARNVESLNVGAAAAIVLFERVRQLDCGRVSLSQSPRG